MKQPNYKDPEFVEGLGWETDLDETTCTPEILAYLDRTYEERKMPLDEWQALYAKRVKEGYYQQKKVYTDEDPLF